MDNPDYLSFPYDLEYLKKFKEFYTNGQAAKFCLVSPRTFAKWFDAGKIKGYKIPPPVGSKNKSKGDRRIEGESLVDFMKKHDLPFTVLENYVWYEQAKRTKKLYKPYSC